MKGRVVFALATAGLAVAAAPARAADCPTTGAARAPLMEHQGFGSETAPVPGQAATCTPSWPAVTVGAPADAQGSCEVIFFKGAKLPNGWRLKSYTIVGLPYHKAPKAAADTLEIRIVATAPAGESDNVSLGKVIFSGADCSKLWADLGGE